jgi:hypothetical protein
MKQHLVCVVHLDLRLSAAPLALSDKRLLWFRTLPLL